MFTSENGGFLSWIFLVAACLFSFSRSGYRNLTCSTQSDDIFHGTLVNCSSKNITPTDIFNLDIPIDNTTSLLLNHNSLPLIKDRSFFRLRKLCRLQIDYSRITKLNVDAFEGLTRLQILSLYGNFLHIASKTTLPFGVFSHTPLLNDLNIGYNPVPNGFGNYSWLIDTLGSLRNFRRLSIPSFPTLYIGKEFEKLSRLEQLEIDGYFLFNILNYSLEGLQCSNIKHFKLSFASPYKFEREVFKSLPQNITSLSLYRVFVGNKELLRAMKELRNRTIPVLYFNTVSLPRTINPTIQIQDGMINSTILTDLLNICISNLTWKNSNIISLDLTFKANSTFKSCIRSIDISGNKLQLYRLSSFIPALSTLQFLEELRLSRDGLPKHTKNFWDENEENLLKIISQDDNQEGDFQIDSPLVSLTQGCQTNCSSPSFPGSSTPQNVYPDTKSDEYKQQKKRLFNQHDLEEVGFRLSRSNHHHNLPLSPNPNNLSFSNSTIVNRTPNHTIYIYLPEHVSYTSFDTVRGFDFGESYNYLAFANPNIVKEVYCRYVTTPIVIKCLILGLNKLRLIDFTGTLIQEMPLNFFDSFPSLQVLVLSQTQKDPTFFHVNGRRLIKKITNLIYLDLSNNDLSILPEGIFQDNHLLRYLCLAKNRFSTIPFQIRLTPSLKKLDLRMNAFSTLDKEEQVDIDEHIQIIRGKTFTLLLKGNNLQCICSDFLFAAWMHRTLTQFDPKGDLTCLGEDGNIIKIEAFPDMEQMWRKCNGQYYLMLSLLFLFAMFVLYLAVFLISMYQTYIIGKLKQIFIPEFQRQTRQDFTYDVFIGYADQECAFVRFQLLRYLEDILKLKAFVHQRDLRQDLLQLGTALKDSWRTLLVITEAFLAHEMSENIMKTATFFESPSKQDSIIVMVTQDLLYAIPDYVLRVVKDENIIVLPDWETPFSYEATETLRTRILY